MGVETGDLAHPFHRCALPYHCDGFQFDIGPRGIRRGLGIAQALDDKLQGGKIHNGMIPYRLPGTRSSGHPVSAQVPRAATRRAQGSSSTGARPSTRRTSSVTSAV